MKFIYSDKVKVVKGFYKGQTGKVTDYKCTVDIVYGAWYTVRNGRLKFENIPEEYLEKV